VLRQGSRRDAKVMVQLRQLVARQARDRRARHAPDPWNAAREDKEVSRGSTVRVPQWLWSLLLISVTAIIIIATTKLQST